MKYLFLDLENTVIDSWENLIVLNNPKVQETIRSINPEKIGIYSFAIWDDKDKETFKTMLFADITKTYNINIDLELLFSVPDIIKISGFDPKMKPNEFIKSYGKELSFIQFSKKKFGGNGNETFLIDDLVEDTYIESKNIKITMLNPIRVDKNYQPSTLALSLPNVSVSQSG
ncbi:MAG: hypothetical protein H7A25_26660 [Leptospiraceae bacterium]|nr:hypothetical protein [Leptospiraceae bacterium]MCP5503510.1 hypothetical protein [Leptospiraceae bacterium]